MSHRLRVPFIDGTWGIPMTLLEIRSLGLIEEVDDELGTISCDRLVEYARDHLWFHPWREEIFQVVPLEMQQSLLLHGKSRW